MKNEKVSEFLAILKDKEKLKKLLVFTFDTILLAASYIFLAMVFIAIVIKFVSIVMQEPIYKYYLCGILFIFAIGISIANIESYNKKYRKNDSDSSKRQNDYFFEGNILREERRYSDRRDLEQS